MIRLKPYYDDLVDTKRFDLSHITQQVTSPKQRTRIESSSKSQSPSFSLIKTPSFNVKIQKDKNPSLQQVIHELIPYKDYKKKANNSMSNQYLIEVHNKLSPPPLPINKENRQEFSSSIQDIKGSVANPSISPSLKIKLIEELWQGRRSASIDIVDKAKTKEELEKNIDVAVLSDGSVVVKPIDECQKQVRGSIEITTMYSASQFKKPFSENKLQRTICNSNSLKMFDSPYLNVSLCGKKSFKNINITDNKKIMSSKDSIKKHISMMIEKSSKPPKKKKLKDSIKLDGITDDKPQTVIKTISWRYEELHMHPFNIFIRNYNEFIKALKEKDPIKSVRSLTKVLNVLKMPHPKINIEYIQSKEHIAKIKQHIITQLNELLYKINNTGFSNEGSFKYYIGKGNNHMLIKSLLKQRTWWTQADKSEISKANLVWTQLLSRKYVSSLPTLIDTLSNGEKPPFQIANHMENHYHISNKKSLYLNVKSYYQKLGIDPYQVIPLTFHITGLEDVEMTRFEKCYEELMEAKDNNIWIIKPGEFTNRGNGITVCKDIADIKAIIKRTEEKRTNIVQKYIDKPLLINKRKFDVRTYALITSINGCIKAYFYNDGYLRTSCKEYSIKNLSNKYIHLTNDAIQKNNDEYGKFETGNKLSYSDLQKYINLNYSELNIDFQRDINSQIKVSRYADHNHR